VSGVPAVMMVGNDVADRRRDAVRHVPPHGSSVACAGSLASVRRRIHARGAPRRRRRREHRLLREVRRHGGCTSAATAFHVAWVSDRTRPVRDRADRGADDRATPALSAGQPASCGAGAVRAHGRRLQSRRRSIGSATLARPTVRLSRGPSDYGPPVGYCGVRHGSDGHNAQLSYGQEVGLTVDHARSA
jgi:hypothetical protein